MEPIAAALSETIAFIQERVPTAPRVGIVLGTGLHALAGLIDVTHRFPYAELPHFPKSATAFHQGALLFGTLSGVPVVAMQGRFHYYDGFSMAQLTFPVRVLGGLGIRQLLLSNAAGGMNPAFRKGDLVIADDHINLLPDNPLRGLGDAFGNRFTDMSAPYNARLQELLSEAIAAQGLPVHKGVYVSVMGPNLETRAEYRWLRSMGADTVGMSTVPEVIVANQIGIECAAVSVITDECDPDNLKPVNIAEIIEVAGQADQKLSKVFAEVVGKLA
ncbi:purine-nucleoside phosphorylase [Flaviaesturariibacter amylovorans]|uniref:Purine nucleoside phosphorylase n=1 Tax=Flaviaesturariibacter amylovorans TaxID=1084520 RepID=A0ABP8HQ35_9BACT